MTVGAFSDDHYQRRHVRWASVGQRRRALLFADQNVALGWPVPGPIHEKLSFPAASEVEEAIVVEESEDDVIVVE